QQALAVLPAQAFHTEAGQGVSAVVADREVVLGTPDWLRQHHITVDESAQAQFHHLATAGKTVIGVGVAGQLAGLIAVQDRLRPDAVETVQRLRQMGLRVLMLTGDQLPVAEAVARPLGLTAEDIVAQVRPDQKAEVIRSLQQGEDSAAKSLPRTVAMVGDGINDAPALAQADVGIALNSGTDVAIESAGIILMHNRLSDVVTALELSRATFKKIQQNLFWALIYNALGIPIAAGLLLPSWGIVLSPAMAGALMAFSSVSVVTNSLLLRRRFQSQLSLN
ncbi:MAG: HAD-IC family P-type ATPase, partial [Synechococcales cyanobacterium M58_A2018_015]|nr:HAD-IC family P-type ATPase [Synechococcales cyanobacterium M58_A2018_015]